LGDQALFSTSDSISDKNIYQLNPAICLHQEFSSFNFLPEKAKVSRLEEKRRINRRAYSRSKKKSILHKVFLELNRPLEDLKRYLKIKSQCLFDGTKWIKIDFLP